MAGIRSCDALKSLNETVYFLRRVFEPDYKDDLSPGTCTTKMDVVWLDEELVRRESARMRGSDQASRQ